MTDTTFTIEGLEDVEQLLADAPSIVVANAFLKALQAGVEVIVKELEPRTPERDENDRDEDTAHLKESLTADYQIDSRLRGGVARVGFGAQGHKALWVEYGHRMVTHKPGKRQVGFVPAHPFMRPAADAAAEGAIDAFAKSLSENLRTNPVGAKSVA